MKTFNIKYEIHLKDGNVIKDKEINVKKCEFGVEAQYKLENYLKKKYPNFKKIVVISCKEDVMSIFDDMFGKDGGPFGDMFNGLGDLTAGGAPFGKN